MCLHVAMYSRTDPTAELQIARRKIDELESLNTHIKSEVNKAVVLKGEREYQMPCAIGVGE